MRTRRACRLDVEMTSSTIKTIRLESPNSSGNKARRDPDGDEVSMSRSWWADQLNP